jgi:hypothetical protein
VLGGPISFGWFIAFCIFGCRCMAACSLAYDCGFLSKEIQIADPIQSITIGDFNNDSRPDIAVRTSEDVSVLLNTTGGNFSSPIRTPLQYTYALAGRTDHGGGQTEIAADFNGDGSLDLAIRDRNQILFGVGDGAFLPPQLIRGEYPTFYGLTASGDFNADQKPDLVFHVRGSVAILLGNGDGTFRLGSTADLGGDGQLLVADFNRDGRSDLAYLQYRDGSGNYDPNCCNLRILLGQGEGTFQDPIQIAETGPGEIIAADFNDDQVLDIVTIDAVLLGKGDGSFEAARRFFAGASFDYWYAPPTGPAAAADLNGDARVDLVYYGSSEGRTIFGLLGKGDGTLSPLNPSSYWLHVWENVDRRIGGTADLDGDGRPDLVTATYCALSPNPLFGFCGRANDVTILLNRTEVEPR